LEGASPEVFVNRAVERKARRWSAGESRDATIFMAIISEIELKG
jgi:hypothetical protein